MKKKLNREAALELLKEYNESESLINHGLAVSGVMTHFSILGRKPFWACAPLQMISVWELRRTNESSIA